MPKDQSGGVKNRAPAPIQISAEQILREAADRQEPHILDPITKVHDAEEYQSHLASRRKHFEDNIRYRREHIGNWVKYAKFEEEHKEFERARSVFERALEVDHRSAELWLRYGEFEMRNEFVNRARNVLDRAVSILPRVDFLWYKYAYMEETVGNLDGCRELFERWMTWHPDEGAWLSFARFEMRAAKAQIAFLGKEVESNIKPDMTNATEVMKRYVNEYPSAKSFLKLAKWAEYESRDMEFARKVYEGIFSELEPEESKQAKVFAQFTSFEERRGEYERARVIYGHAMKLLELEKIHHQSKENDQTMNVNDGEISEFEIKRREQLYKAYISFEKKYGNKDDIESIVLTKQRREYEKRVKTNPYDYDAWFEYAKLEEDYSNSPSSVRDVYERAVSNLPPGNNEKKYWKRYIYLWIYYAIYEELNNQDLERACKIYEACLSLIPHKLFSFSKVWIYAAKLHIRRKDLNSARKLLGKAIGICGKEQIFVEYIALELALGEVDRCRLLYTNYLKAMPYNCKAWVKYADLEHSVGEIERCRALYDLAISQETLDMPEMLWKKYIDFELDEGEGENARKLYNKLLANTDHVKVWISYAQFEGTEVGKGISEARKIFKHANEKFKQQDQKEERILVLEAWKVFEVSKGDESSVREVEAMMPRRIKRKRMRRDEETGDDLGWEEYFDYHFPDDNTSMSGNLKILEMAASWKQKMQDEESDEDSDEESDEDSDNED